MRRRRQIHGGRLLALATVVLLAACGGDDGTDDAAAPATTAPTTTAATGDDSEATACATPGDRFPAIEAVEVSAAGDGTVDLAVTVTSPYDTPERYADGWRVLAPDGAVLGVHGLAHDHAAEQPFTRTQRGVEIPDGVEEITVEGRDQCFGFGGETVTVAIP